MLFRRRNGMVVLSVDRMPVVKKQVLLTRKLADDGQMRYGVVLYDGYSGRHGKYMKVKVVRTISEAFNLYKQVRALG